MTGNTTAGGYFWTIAGYTVMTISGCKQGLTIKTQARYYLYLYALTNIIYVSIPIYFWGETIKHAILCCFAAQYILHLHSVWSINSFAHYYGSKPYDRHIQAVDNWIIHQITIGEGMHNYHHTFPWDWRNANSVSVGGVKNFSYLIFIIEVWAFFGLIYDRKTTSQELITNRAQNTGDGTYKPKLQ